MMTMKKRWKEMMIQGKEKTKDVKKSTWILLGIFTIILIVSGVYALIHMDMETLLAQIKALPLVIKYMVMILLTSMQIFLAFLPGEPLELASGYLFGAWQGTAVCLVGSFLGTAIVYGLVQVFRHSIIDKMFDQDKVEEVGSLFATKKGMFWVFILFLIPGSPKDVMTYIVSLGNISLIKWLLLTTIGRIPSIVTSTFLSGSLKEGNVMIAVLIGCITLVLVLFGTLFYKKILKTNKINEKAGEML